MRLPYIAIFLAITTASLCEAIAAKCDADLTTKFAIGKRQREKELECRVDAIDVENCENVDEVNDAWLNFEKINDEYKEAVTECKIIQHSKRRRSSEGCGCNMNDPDKDARRNTETLGVHRVRRNCGCGHHSDVEENAKTRGHHHQHAHLHHHAKDVADEDTKGHARVKRNCGCNVRSRVHKENQQSRQNHEEDEHEETIEKEEKETSESRSRIRRHRQHNAAELQKHERGTHGRAHTPNRHGGHRSRSKAGKKMSRKKQGRNHRRRHDHGSNDDFQDPEAVPEARDRSKDFPRVRRGVCMLEGSKEQERLQEKYASLCDISNFCDRENLSGDKKRDMNVLSRKRQRSYREYLSVFNRCYGSVEQR